jgi:hypothetical protein
LVFGLILPLALILPLVPALAFVLSLALMLKSAVGPTLTLRPASVSMLRSAVALPLLGVLGSEHDSP